MAGTAATLFSSALGSGGELGGYSYEFLVEPSSLYFCSICTKVLRNPHLTGCCGHEFCQACLEKWHKTSKKRTCPHCRATNFDHMLNKRTEREISQLKVRCNNRKQGCKWEGELLAIENHLKVCGFLQLHCEKCLQVLKRMELEKHRSEECRCRTSKCTCCGKEAAYWMIVSIGHMSECPGYPVNCPNGCGESEIKRSMVQLHQSVCPLEFVECPFRDANCQTRLLRKDLQSHSEASSQQHLQGLLTAFQQMKFSLSQTQKQLTAQGQHLTELRMFKANLDSSMKGIASEVDDLLALKETTVKQATALRSIKSLAASSVLQLSKKHPVVSFSMPNYSSYVSVPSVPPIKRKPRDPDSSVVSRNTSELVDKSKVWKSQPFFVQDGYKMFLQVTVTRGSLSVKLCLLEGELDDQLNWPCNVDFRCIDIALMSGNHAPLHLRTPRCYLGAAGTIVNSSPQKCAFGIDQVIWQHDTFSHCPLSAQYVHQDGSITFQLAWMQFRTVSPEKEGSRPVHVPSTLRRRWQAQGSAFQSYAEGEHQDTALPGFTFTYSGPNPTGGRGGSSHIGLGARLLLEQQKARTPED